MCHCVDKWLGLHCPRLKKYIVDRRINSGQMFSSFNDLQSFEDKIYAEGNCKAGTTSPGRPPCTSSLNV